eukprot:1633572-Ditylum_brightwellii.AAC.1
MFPVPITTASTSLPNVRVNIAFTPISGQSKQHNQRKFQPRKKTYTTEFAGCQGCQADSESQ